MGSKAFVLLGLVLAIMLLMISSEVAARDLAETSSDQENAEFNKDIHGVNGIVDTDGSYGGGRGKYGGKRGGCYYGCCRRGYYGNRCRKCCSYAGEAMHHVDAETDPSSQTPGLN